MNDDEKAARLAMIKRSWRAWKNDQAAARSLNAPPNHNLIDYAQVRIDVRTDDVLEAVNAQP